MVQAGSIHVGLRRFAVTLRMGEWIAAAGLLSLAPEEERIVSTESNNDLAGPLADEAAERTGRPRKKTAAVVILVLGLLAAATVLGSALPDPTASDEYISLAGEKQYVEAELNSLKSDYKTLGSTYDALQGGITDREAKIKARETEISQADAAVKEADEAVKAAEAAVKKREEAVAGAEKEKAANTIGDGVWTVGADIEPGTYRSAAAVEANCYWGVYESGTNGSNIIENDIPGGGRPEVTLSEGQDFRTTRCGTWEKQ